MPRKRRHPRRTKKETAPKPGVSGARFRKERAFKNSRRAAGDFGTASQCAVLIRNELFLLEKILQNEIHKKLSKIIGTLIRNKRASGEERIRLNHLQWKQLEELAFNHDCGLVSLLLDTTKVDVNPASGEITITHPSFNVTPRIKTKKSATHARIISGAAAINFDRKTASHDYSATDHIFIEERPVEKGIILSLKLPAPIIHPLFVVFGIVCFTQEDDKSLCELHDRRYKALSIIYVHPAPPPAYKAKKKATPPKPTPKKK